MVEVRVLVAGCEGAKLGRSFARGRRDVPETGGEDGTGAEWSTLSDGDVQDIRLTRPSV